MLNKPFLKWAGNKSHVLTHLHPLLPKSSTLIEPFAGSAAVFLNTNYQKGILNDINPDLISLYQILQVEGQKFIDYASQYFQKKHNTALKYYDYRDTFNSTKNLRKKAALFLYLNRHGFNGLCRYNQSGKFNVPFGRYIKPYFPEKEMIYFHQKTQKVVFTCQDFREVMKKAKASHVIYCDPPYVPLSTTAAFTQYSQKGFGLEEQIALAQLAEQLSSQKKVSIIISNHATPFTRELYHKAQKIEFFVRRNISCKGASRKPVMEIAALF